MRISDWSSVVCSSDLRAVDDLELPVLVEEAGVAGMHPAVGGLGLGGRLGNLEILPEHAGAAEQHLATLVDPDLDLRRRRRSEERRVGKEWARPCRSRWLPHH